MSEMPAPVSAPPKAAASPPLARRPFWTSLWRLGPLFPPYPPRCSFPSAPATTRLSEGGCGGHFLGSSPGLAAVAFLSPFMRLSPHPTRPCRQGPALSGQPACDLPLHARLPPPMAINTLAALPWAHEPSAVQPGVAPRAQAAQRARAHHVCRPLPPLRASPAPRLAVYRWPNSFRYPAPCAARAPVQPSQRPHQRGRALAPATTLPRICRWPLKPPPRGRRGRPQGRAPRLRGGAARSRPSPPAPAPPQGPLFSPPRRPVSRACVLIPTAHDGMDICSRLRTLHAPRRREDAGKVRPAASAHLRGATGRPLMPNPPGEVERRRRRRAPRDPPPFPAPACNPQRQPRPRPALGCVRASASAPRYI
jgi:hypothetical protein